MLFELRQYYARPGRREEFVKLMEEEIIPFNFANGVAVVGSFIGEDDADAYVWIRRFADEADRVRAYAAIYQSEHWRQRIAPRTAELLDRERIRVTRLFPTPRSVTR